MINGNAILSIWHDIDAQSQASYVEWHILEHMPERASIPGFVRGRRGVAVGPNQSPRYVTLYEAADVEIFRSKPYLERLDNPTVWTQRIQPSFQNFVRFANEVTLQRGSGDGVYLTTARFETSGETSIGYADIETRMVALIETLEKLPFVVSVTLTRSRDDITNYVTEETELRPVNPALTGLQHVAMLSVDTATEAAAGTVRAHILAAESELKEVRVGHCASYLIDYVIDEHQVQRTPLTGNAIDGRSQA